MDLINNGLDKLRLDAKPGEAISNDDFFSQSELINSLKVRIEELETDSIIKNQDIESQSELISSLKFRIEELETGVITKNQDIEKQNIEIQQLKQELNEFKTAELKELKKVKQEIEVLNDFKSNFMLLFDTFNQTTKESKSIDISAKQYEIRSIDCIKDSSDRSKIVSYTNNSKCGVKIAVGETYYYCWTCTTRNNSVLCRRCYQGTNHSGHSVVTKLNHGASTWCDCGDSSYWKEHLNCKYHSSDVSCTGSSLCGVKITIGETYYHCRTCTSSSNSVLCRRCYEGSNHSRHDVLTSVNSDASNWCDCGDPDYWKVHLNCKYHSSNMSESPKCGAKLAIGETYYHCRTCTARGNSILCRRCYEGTNHSGHDVIRGMNNSASNWCDCGDSDYWKVHLNCKHHSSNMSESSQCGATLAVGETYYHCRTCTTRGNSILCRRCYEGTNHRRHDVITRTNSSASNWCDCGDPDYWKVHLNCKHHPSNM